MVSWAGPAQVNVLCLPSTTGWSGVSFTITITKIKTADS